MFRHKDTAPALQPGSESFRGILECGFRQKCTKTYHQILHAAPDVCSANTLEFFQPLNATWCNLETTVLGLRFNSQGFSGVPEVGSGLPSLLSSPLSAADSGATKDLRHGHGSQERREGIAHSTALECERLFCQAMRAVFRRSVHSPSLNDPDADRSSEPTLQIKDNEFKPPLVTEWFEVWDYAGGASFRGFVAGETEKSLFVFFDRAIVGTDLRSGSIASAQLKSLMRDLGWVGFHLVGLDDWAHAADVISPEWLFLGMEV
ncbi:MAG: hypothetical protein M1837_000204 [Sclerophora amabilis]|nr:MAG: hypothetical protein M1837_000204 [Sclerophora amabilis]